MQAAFGANGVLLGVGFGCDGGVWGTNETGFMFMMRGTEREAGGSRSIVVGVIRV